MVRKILVVKPALHGAKFVAATFFPYPNASCCRNGATTRTSLLQHCFGVRERLKTERGQLIEIL